MPVQYLKGVGPAKAKIFAQMQIETLGDLLEYFPRDWNFIADTVKIDQVRDGQEVSIVGLVESVDFQRFSKSQLFEAMLADQTGILRMIWFHGGYLTKQIEPGMTIMVSGKVAEYKHQLQMTNPKFMIITDTSINPGEFFAGGVYRASAGLSSNKIKSVIRPILENLDQLVSEFYDENFRKEMILVTRKDAFNWIHMPPDEEKLAKAKRRLKYDELFLMQLGLALRRYRMQHFSHAKAMTCSEQIDRRIRQRFPFMLTADQDQTISEIVADMSRPEPMNRLLQGDVGSGKTVVALYAALLAVANKTQVAIMAPTEILAEQHFLSIEKYLKDSQVNRVLLTGGLTGKKRTDLLEKISTNQIDIVVGTVALLQKDIEFENLRPGYNR